jgi:cell division protein FtsN
MKQQRGGTFLGFIIGVVVGLGTALAVAVYVTKVPIPFIDKGPSRSDVQNAAETQKNNGWDPNAPLYGKNPAKPVAPVAPAEAASAPAEGRAEGGVASSAKTEVKPAVSADPLGDLAKARASASSTVEPFTYFVQVGAFRTPEDAESQRAKLSLGGVQAKVSEREQSGRTVYRVRVGPFDTKDEADKTKARLDASGLETALVRVAR